MNFEAYTYATHEHATHEHPQLERAKRQRQRQQAGTAAAAADRQVVVGGVGGELLVQCAEMSMDAMHAV